MVQSALVERRLASQGHQVELVRILTDGDLRPIDLTPGEGVFVVALARALLAGKIDIAVHSAKDVPLETEPELILAAYPERGDPRDALVTSEGGRTLETIKAGAVVGTDSPRRAGFLRSSRPDIQVVPLHGNVDTRLRRLDAGEVDAVVLAAAGLDRLDQGRRIDQRIDPAIITPAPAQGALAIQARAGDKDLLAVLRSLDDPLVRVAVESERVVLRATGGTCRAPVGALGAVKGERFLLLVGGVSSDGSERRVQVHEGAIETALELAHDAGRQLAREVALR
jgi:hydroxymethylbilane synthase